MERSDQLPVEEGSIHKRFTQEEMLSIANRAMEERREAKGDIERYYDALAANAFILYLMGETGITTLKGLVCSAEAADIVSRNPPVFPGWPLAVPNEHERGLLPSEQPHPCARVSESGP